MAHTYPIAGQCAWRAKAAGASQPRTFRDKGADAVTTGMVQLSSEQSTDIAPRAHQHLTNRSLQLVNMLTKTILSIICFLSALNFAGAQTATAAKSRFDVKMTGAQNAAIPDVRGGLPVLAGTTWAVISIYQKGSIPKTQFRPANFLFLKDGKWEHQTGSLFLGGTYTVKGATLSTTDEGATKANEWKLRWDGSVKELEMEQGNLIFVLRYQGKTQS
jgi:hypothetical protein